MATRRQATTGRQRPARRSPAAPGAVDELDHQILELLRRDARMSTRSIGRELGVAAGTVSQRIARLESDGVIRGYAAVIDATRLGRPLGFIMGLQITQGNELNDVLDELTDLDGVDDVYVVTGQWDVVVVGRVADTDELDRVLTSTIWKSPSFRHSETMLIVRHRDAHD